MGQLIKGYASVFNVPDLNDDIVRPGAYGAHPNPLPMMLNHRGAPMGYWTTIREDAYGLWVEGHADEPVDLSLYPGLSIGFITRESIKRTPRGRELLKIELWEVSVVPKPMCPQALVQLAA